ncbi:MAG: 50S ribosomal protein L6 [Euryarchaeota archaeon]|nr:50S ribosomal protein L6 [Euryarchaeota archaeon]
MGSKYLIEERVAIPAKVKVSIAGRVVNVEGPKGKLAKALTHPDVTVEMDGKDVVVGTNDKSRKVYAMIGTYRAHIQNMFYGATEGYEFRMKAVYSHFPLKIVIKGDVVMVENYLGEKAPRKAKVVGGTKVVLKGDELTLTGPDIEMVGQSAANIEKATRRSGYDTRIFQDGIYITKKGERAAAKEA